MINNLYAFMLVLMVTSYNQTYAQKQKSNFNTLNTTLIKPPFLKVGDTVAIVAPSGILKNRTIEIEKAKSLLNHWGLHVVVGKHLFSQNNHFAGTDDERCEDFQNAMDNPSIKAIWCARGGYGAVRILDKLDFTSFKKHPKWLIGYSDITALHNLFHNAGFETLHAMMCTSLQDAETTIPETISTFKKALFGESLKYVIPYSKYNKKGTVKAPIVGGNLAVLASLLGSSTSIDTADKILFLEEIGEYEYVIDRYLQSLKRAGYFNNCAGVLVGDLSKIKVNSTPWGSSVQQLILEALKEYQFPIAFGFPAGHEKDNRALILGATVALKINDKETSINFINP